MASKKFVGRFLICLVILTLIVPATASAGQPAKKGDTGNWWDVEPEEETPSPHYDSLLYSEIAPRLREIEVNSNRVQVEVIGQSAGGRNMFLVTLSDPQAMGRLGQYQAIRNTMLKDPEKAQSMIEKFGDFKVPFFINGSIHGGEYPGVDAAIRLIETLAYGDSPEVQAILENVILLVNVVANPDGRVMGTRRNANGFDLNRDFIAQSQPETRAMVEIFTEWNPMVVLDLHGFVNPMLIEPCTPPHNPNYEYDLYLKWALDQAYAMEAELFAQTGFSAQIPYRDDPLGWDDWPPSYTPMYAMYHGAYGHTLETPYRDERGVDAHYAAVWGALNFVAENREDMLYDQIEIFRRGFLDLPQMLIPDELLDESQWDQYNELTIQEFPAAHIIPKDAPLQMSPHQAARLVDFLVFNDVQVEQAVKAFSLDGVAYPKGTYVVWMDQPKRGLANTFLEDGRDLSAIPGLFFYSPPSVWSHPLLWGATRVVMEDDMAINTVPVKNADPVQGSAEGGTAAAYAFLPTNLAAFQAVNILLEDSVPLLRAAEPFSMTGQTFGAGTVVLPDDPALANELANQYAQDVFALDHVPAGLVAMAPQRLAVYGDEGLSHALKTLGFNFDEVSRSDLNAGAITAYDVFINDGLRWSQLNADGQAAMADWFAGGGDYIGLPWRGRGAQFALDAGLLDLTFENVSGNAIVKVDFNAEDSVAAGFWPEDYAFVYYPVWFTHLGAGVEAAAFYDSGDFLVSGFWPEWEISGAADTPIIVHNSAGDQDTVLIGMDVSFRGHPENGFRILANAIFSGLE